MAGPSYDPTDFGNEPGRGPLRVGGQTKSMEEGSRTEDNLPSYKSKAARRQATALERVRDLWEGQDAVHRQSTAYLPKNPAEEPEFYASRLARTPFHNFFRRAVEGMVGLVYRIDPELGDDVPPKIRDLWENIDNAGTHGDVFCRDVSTDAMVAGHAAILVEFPKTDGNQTAAAEDTGAVRPYWVPIMKENILSWRTSVEKGNTLLDQVVLYECSMVPSGDFGEKEQKRYRVLRRDGEAVGFTVYEITENKEVRIVDEGSYMNQSTIPISEMPTSGRRALFDSDPPLLDVANLNVAYYQQYSDMIESQHKTVPFLFMAGIPTMDDEGNPVVIAAGPNNAIVSDNSDAKAAYVAHQGDAIKDQRASLEELKNDIGSLSLAMLSPQKRTAETATAKRLDKSQSDSALAVTARAWQDGIERALQFTANYLRLDSGGSVTINRDFEGLVMEAEVMRAYAELVKAGFPKSIALTMLQQGGRIAEDVDIEQLEMEMMANEAAAEAMRQQEMEERMATLPRAVGADEAA